jgi:trans-AT polyketide synthase/acyltransferase/oxidoreductase domain-containing protein
MQAQELVPVGFWKPDSKSPAFSSSELSRIIPDVRDPIHIVREAPGGRLGLGKGGRVFPLSGHDGSGLLLMATLPALFPEWLGDRSFLEVHSLRFPYVAGAMFRGIASCAMVVEMARAGMIGFFGAGGLSLDQIEAAVDEIETSLGNPGPSWGSNLLHAPDEPELEEATVDLYLRRGVRRVSAAAFMSLPPSVVRYACTGLHTDPSGRIQRRNFVFAKLSRPEVAALFMSPPPADVLDHLVSQGSLTRTEAGLAARLPVAEDITVEADSGGHTDNRPLPALFPTVLALRDELMERHGYPRPIRLGIAGGIGTPSSVAGAFSMGAAYVLTASVNQSAVEAGLSMEGKKMLALADVVDVGMAPAADMFELGVKVQVLKRGSMFSGRAAQLHTLYSTHDSLESLPPATRERLERDLFRAPMEEIWDQTYRFFAHRNPAELKKAEQDPKHRMALIFRWYLGQTAQWAIDGDPERRFDYQICCGPSMGAFNAWVRGSHLEAPENRTVVDIARNLMEGAAVVTRAHQLRSYGVPVSGSSFSFPPRPLS